MAVRTQAPWSGSRPGAEGEPPFVCVVDAEGVPRLSFGSEPLPVDRCRLNALVRDVAPHLKPGETLALDPERVIPLLEDALALNASSILASVRSKRRLLEAFLAADPAPGLPGRRRTA